MKAIDLLRERINCLYRETANYPGAIPVSEREWDLLRKEFEIQAPRMVLVDGAPTKREPEYMGVRIVVIRLEPEG